jgi:uncharacterized RDD family membrane protein YckC
MAAGAAYCSHCGHSFTVAAGSSQPPLMRVAAMAPATGTAISVPAYASSAAMPRVEYAGFWVRFLAFLIDNVVMGIAFFLILIPLIFLTRFGSFLEGFHPDQEMNDANIFMLIGIIFLIATVSLLLTWLYHALMESSEWQATLGKKALGLVVTDMAGNRVSFARSTGRHFGKLLTNLVPAFIGYIMAGFTDKKQALHDMLAGCLVLRRND